MASGLAGAPTTKLLLASSVLMTLVAMDDKAAAKLFLDDGSQVFSSKQLWRLFTSLFPFENLAEALLGWLLLYRLSRTCEHMLGSAKYTVFVLLSSAAAVGARLTLLTALPPALRDAAGSAVVAGGGVAHSWLRTGLASGPYHILFGLLPLYYAYVPARTPVYFKLASLSFSDKSGTYACAAALAACMGSRSLLASAYSLAFGVLYTLPGPGKGLQAIPVPYAVRAGVASLLRAVPFLGEDGGIVGVARGGAGGAGASASGRTAPAPAQDDEGIPPELLGSGRGAGAVGSVPLGPEPGEEAVERLTALGFPREDCVAALRATWGNEEAAANRLLSN